MARGGARPGAGRKPKGHAKAKVPVPKLASVGLQVAARRHAENALKALADALHDDSTNNRIAAAKELLDRAYGKAAQEKIHKGDEDHPIRHIIERHIIGG